MIGGEKRAVAERGKAAFIGSICNEKPSWPADIYRAFEKETLEAINERHREIGVMRVLMETFPDDKEIRQTAESIIKLNIDLIEEDKNDVFCYRKTVEGLQRG